MGFIRIKKIKNKNYAYKVENEWTNKGSRQRVKKYIGKIIKITNQIPVSVYLKHTNFNEAILLLASNTLSNIGFKQEIDLFKKDKTLINLKTREFLEKNKNIAISVNEGFLCKETLEELISFEPTEKEDETAIKLANTLLEAGLKIEKNTFVELFEKLMPKKKEETEKIVINY